ncbi:hypothetical protein [Actinomadura sp. DC4]|uniref:hypothetical protein n=1 Tax=Actinomadura sp. DC4 TaxID=3055069 RepID=UPI0025B077B8|nr:hypothetical protein [Actinomadura sp. DC4]MDN3359588.1 hypothetical protein [Actinomadura sp. DC4]
MTGIPVTASVAHAATVHVPCSTASLISAVNAANTAGAGTLLLASRCNYVLTAAAGSGRGPDGLPVITGSLRITGGASTLISRSATAAPFRVIEVAPGATLELSSLFVSGGNAEAVVPANDTGGGILNSRGTIRLSRVTVSGNTADSGAGISNDSGRLSVMRTLVENNTTRAGGGGGGGLYNDGSIRIAFSILRGNHASTNGGALYNGQGGKTETIRTTFEANSATATGGGLYTAADGRLVLQTTLVRRNIAGNGGGVFNAGILSRVTLVGSLVVLNTPNNCAPAGSVALCTG